MILAAQALDIVREHIERIKDAEARWKDYEADPASTSDQRFEAKVTFERNQEEFWLQWRNVERILQECLREGL